MNFNYVKIDHSDIRKVIGKTVKIRDKIDGQEWVGALIAYSPPTAYIDYLEGQVVSIDINSEKEVYVLTTDSVR